MNKKYIKQRLDEIISEDREKTQMMYDYISEKLDDSQSEQFAWWLAIRKKELEYVYNLVRQWQGDKK